MEITEVRISLHEPAARAADAPGGRLKAYATLTFDHCFVVRNVKVIDGKNGLFVAMPSHKPKVACGRCHFKSDLGGRFCSQCGAPFERPMDRSVGSVGADAAETQARPGDEEGRSGAHRDLAHPITVEFRRYLQQKVLEAYDTERAKIDRPGPAVTDQTNEPGMDV